MAEQTPHGLFGGWVPGRAAGNRGLDQAIDRLEDQVNRFADVLQKATGTMAGATGNGGISAGEPTMSSGKANGGGATFGGVAAAAAATSHRAEGDAVTSGGGGGGRYRGNGAAASFFDDHKGTMGKAAVGGSVAGMAVFSKNHDASQVTGQTLAQMYSYGGGWSKAYQKGMTGDYVSHGDADHWAMISMMGQRSGSAPGTTGWSAQYQRQMSYAAVNPMATSAQVVGANVSLGSVGSFNKFAGLGINPMDQQGKMGDSRSVARQILQRMGATNAKSIDQVANAFGPGGSITVTLDNYQMAGYIDSKSRKIIEQEMRNILTAQVNGMDYKTYNRHATAANESGDSRKALEKAGIAADTLTQTQYRKEGKSRETEAATVEGFTTGVKGATTAVIKFREALNEVLGFNNNWLGGKVGRTEGILTRMPLLGGLISKVPGAGMISGVIPGMADGGVLPGYTPGRDVHRFYSPTGGALDLSGGEGILIPQATKALGGEAGIKAINDAFRQSFAKGGTFKNPDQKVSVDGKNVSKIVAAQLALAEKISGINLSVMQGGYGGSHYDASGTSHNYPGVVDISPGSIRVETLLRRLGFAAWARNIPGRSYVGSGRHVHAVSLLDPGNKNHPQITGSWAQNKDGLGGGPGSDPAKHVAWLPNLRRRLGAVNLRNILGGSTTSGAGTGSGGSLDSNGGTALETSNPAGGMGYVTSNTMAIGSYTEVGALGLGGGSTIAMPAGDANGDTGAATSGAGVSSPSGRANLGIGTLNLLKSNTNAQWAADIDTSLDHVNVLGLQEARSRGKFLRKAFGRRGWKYYAGRGGDTGIAWNDDKFEALQKHTLDLTDSRRMAGGNVARSASYVLLRDRDSGVKFWVISSHAQAHTSQSAALSDIQRKQFRELNGLFQRLKKTGIPVFSVGDFNNRNAGGAAVGSRNYGKGLDHILFSGAKGKGSGRVGVNSDHPLVYGQFNIGGASNGSGGSGGSPQQNIALGKQMAANMGWTGADWNALKTLWMHESGWRTNADNPTSSAYGIPQAMTSAHNMPAGYFKDPRVQIRWGLNYIKGRYGDPSKAWNFWQKNNWYDSGEWNIRDDKDARVHKGEMILPSKVADIIRDELASPGIRKILGQGGNGNGATITFAPGAIVVQVPGTTKSQARQSASWVVDAMMDDARIKALAEG